MGRATAVMHTGAGIAVAMGVMNLATYGFTMLAAAGLGPREYGALGATMNLLLVVSVGSLGLQATAARRISAHPGDVHRIERQVRRLVWRVSLGLGAALVLLSPVVDRLLRLDDPRLAVLVGVTAVPLTLVGGYAGILQGERRWYSLSMVYLTNGLPRLVVGVVLLAWAPSAFSAFVGVTLGAFVPVAVGWWALRSRGEEEPGAATGTDHGGRAILRETLHNSQALLAYFALSNLDVVVARNALDRHDAGLYAGGLIMAKMLTFLPQFVVVVAFPAMAAGAERTRALTRSLVGVGGVGLVASAGVGLLSPLALGLVGGAEYAEIQDLLWVFALLGTLLALLQLVVYSVLARQGQRSAYVVWGALAALVLGGLQTSSVVGLLLWVCMVDAALLAVLVAISYVVVQRDADQLEDEPEPLRV